MGLRHKEFAIEGVQFHHESIMTKPGKTLLQKYSVVLTAGQTANLDVE